MITTQPFLDPPTTCEVDVIVRSKCFRQLEALLPLGLRLLLSNLLVPAFELRSLALCFLFRSLFMNLFNRLLLFLNIPWHRRRRRLGRWRVGISKSRRSW